MLRVRKRIDRAAACALWVTALTAIGASDGVAGSAGTEAPAGGWTSTSVTIEATTSFSWIIHEQVENGLLQAGSSDPADDGAIEGLIRLRLEERTDIIDFWGLYRPAPGLAIAIGQMKVPSTGEVLLPDDRLDFITRTTFGRILCDYSLLRTSYISPVMAAKSYNRDLGLAMHTEWPARNPHVRGFFMAGNGLGAGRYIGGSESDEFLHTNSFGELYYGTRLEARPLRRPAPVVEDLVLGAHGSLNRHDDVALDARGPVFDIDRGAWSADLDAALSWGQRIYGFFGSGEMDDDWGTARYRFRYSGWGLSTLWKPDAWPLEFGVRYDEFTGRYRQVEDETTEQHWTFGLNWQPRVPLRLQLNYVAKESVSEADPDLDDNILYINVQFTFAAGPKP